MDFVEDSTQPSVTPWVHVSSTVSCSSNSSCASDVEKEHGPSNAGWMNRIQSVLVTGKTLAAELEEKCRKEEIIPHSGDVCYIFGGCPFRYIEGDLDESSSDEEDDFLDHIVQDEVDDFMSNMSPEMEQEPIFPSGFEGEHALLQVL